MVQRIVVMYPFFYAANINLHHNRPEVYVLNLMFHPFSLLTGYLHTAHVQLGYSLHAWPKVTPTFPQTCFHYFRKRINIAAIPYSIRHGVDTYGFTLQIATGSV